MSATTMNRPAPTQIRHRNGKFAEQHRAEADLSGIGLVTPATVTCHLCPTCQQARDGVDTGENCAIDLGGPCILSPQDCGCPDCGS
jgi:Zn finger protein HypA/HybF involved in hydrogenase expression